MSCFQDQRPSKTEQTKEIDQTSAQQHKLSFPIRKWLILNRHQKVYVFNVTFWKKSSTAEPPIRRPLIKQPTAIKRPAIKFPIPVLIIL